MQTTFAEPPMPGLVDVHVSVVTLTAGDRLATCVRSLTKACHGVSWRLTVVDNSVTGHDLTSLLAPMPDATVIRSEGRRGFGANHNLVVWPLAAQENARYVLILNDDTDLDAHSITALVRCADRDSDVGVVGPLIRDALGRSRGAFYAWPSIWEQVLRTALPKLTQRTSVTSGRLDGACMLVRTSAVREVGAFDTDFFLFFEEIDLCRRIANAGWRLAFCPEATLVHHEHQTVARVDDDFEIDKQMLRSQYLYFTKHRGPLAALVVSYLARLGLAIRAAKMVLEAGIARDRRDLARAQSLWKLVRCRPTQPTRFELEAARDAIVLM